ncbi:MAG TPA: hypothetical protein VGJ23_04080 [Gaiellaceae bacterium]
MKRLLLSATAAVVTLALGASPAAATNECRGLQVCVRVVGPWVVVPAGLGTPRPRVDYQLSCPRGFVVGGLDAQLSDRAIDVEFAGKLGSPVNPGVTTTRSALFGATYTGNSPRGPTFRPHLGCIPSAGGGTGPVPFRARSVFPPGEPTIRRVRNVGLRPGNRSIVAACAAGERLISGWHAIGFVTAAPPSAVQVRSVVATRTLRAGRVEVRVHVGVGTGNVVIQVGAVCGGGS